MHLNALQACFSEQDMDNLWSPDDSGELLLCLYAFTVRGLQESFLSARKPEDPPAQPHGGETLSVSEPWVSQGLQQLQRQS